MSRRRAGALGVVVLIIGALLVLIFIGSTATKPKARHAPPTTTYIPDDWTSPTPTTTTTVPPPPPTTEAPAPEPEPEPVAAPAPHTHAATPSSSGQCPPDPGIPGVRYVCGAGAAGGHRGMSCYNVPGLCPGEAVIAVDPTRTSNPSCVVSNEVYNTTHGYAQVDPNGSCP